MLRPRRAVRLVSAVAAITLIVSGCTDSESHVLEDQSSVDDTAAPRTTAARTTEPDTTVQETSVQETSEPADSGPEATVEDTAATDTSEPDEPEPDATEPDTTEPTDGGYVPRPDSDDAFGWTEAGDGLETGSLDVPIDAEHPDDGSFTLFVERHLANKPDQRIGSLLVNPGGPGYGGTDLADSAEAIYDHKILDHFDIVAWDPRGTGESTPAVDCVDDYDPFFSLDASPDTPEEQQAIIDAATTFGEDCVERSGDILPFVSTAATAADMDRIRQALDEDTISYFGFSYGSELGVTWASLFPDTVRAMVIDGASDQTVDYLQQNLEQAAGFEHTFQTFLDDCASRPDCAFYNDGDPAGAFDELNAQADADPVPTVSGRPKVSQGVLTTAVSDAMYAQFYWPQLERALADLQAGDGKGVLELYDDYYERRSDGSYGDELEAYFAINCLDDPGTKDPQELFDLQSKFSEVAPRLGASWILELQFCASWPIPAAPAVAVDAKGAGPVVVVGTTGDPATPLESTRHQADALEDGRLVIVEADQHTGYGVNDCVDDAVDDYLVDLRAPEDGLTCDR
jgi:pimeloyl-ACP methyl ester carboxylesterase